MITKELHNEVIEWRRHIHANPEVSYEEYETAQFIADTLSKFGNLEITRPTKTSVIAILKGTKQVECKSTTILFRADIDALPIQEKTEFDFASKNPGVMHACGHDVHASMLLGTAKYLASKQAEISGEIRFVFQHAEEVLPGGAQELVKKGVAEGVDYAFALHISPEYKAGQMSFKEGAFCAAADDFSIKIIGKGGHASEPNLTVDPIPIGSEIILAIQQIVSRKLPTLNPPVISVTNFHAGTATNVIPDVVNLSGTLRSLSEDVRVKSRNYIEQILDGVTKAHGAEYEIAWELGYPAITNDNDATNITKIAMEKIFDKKNIVQVEAPIYGTEDFSSFSEVVPSSMQMIGVHNEEFTERHPLHHSKLNVDEEAIKYGVSYFIAVAEEIVF